MISVAGAATTAREAASSIALAAIFMRGL